MALKDLAFPRAGLMYARFFVLGVLGRRARRRAAARSLQAARAHPVLPIALAARQALRQTSSKCCPGTQGGTRCAGDS